MFTRKASAVNIISASGAFQPLLAHGFGFHRVQFIIFCPRETTGDQRQMGDRVSDWLVDYPQLQIKTDKSTPNVD